MKMKFKIGDSIKFKDGKRASIVSEGMMHYYAKDSNGKEIKIKKVTDLLGFGALNIVDGDYDVKLLYDAKAAAEIGYLPKELGKGWAICGSDYWGTDNEAYFNSTKGTNVFAYIKKGEDKPSYLVQKTPDNKVLGIFDRNDQKVDSIPGSWLTADSDSD